MVEQGVDVVNFSVTVGFEGPGDGTSPYWDSLYAAIDLVVESGAVWVNIAGNNAEKTWYSEFQPTEVTDDEGDTIVIHNFGTADEPDFSNDLHIDSEETIIVTMRQGEEDWSDVKCGLGMYLYDAETGELVSYSRRQQRTKDQFEYDDLYYTRKADNANADYELRVQVDEECEEYPEWFQMVILGRQKLGPASEWGHLVTPADSTNPGMLTVGAAPYYDTMTVEPYSNRGPTVVGRVKPDVVGVDCARITSRAVFARGEHPCWMWGTSQASPHVAGLVALVRQRFAGNEAYDTPEEIVSYIQDSAVQRDITPDDPDTMPDPNNLWGHGFAVLEALDVIEYDVDDDGLIEISTLAQLDAVRYDLDGDGIVDPASQADYLAAFTKAVDGMGCPPAGCTGYELTTSLDFDSDGDGDVDADDHGGAWWNSGRGWEPVGRTPGTAETGPAAEPFAATFQGNGFAVENLHISVDRSGVAAGADQSDYFGLFARLGSTATVGNLGIEGVSITAGSPQDGDSATATSYVGALAGSNRGTVSGVYATGRVAAVGDGDVVGGLVGRNHSNAADDPASVATSYSLAAVAGRGSAGTAGGLIGSNSGAVADAYASGPVTGGTTSDTSVAITAVGGLVGSNRTGGTIATGYATGKVFTHADSTDESVGGLVGHNDGTVTHGYWDTTTTGQTQSAGSPDAGAKTTAELQTDTETAVDAADYTGIYTGWHKATWDFGLSCHYPALVVDTNGDGTATWTELGPQPVNCPSAVANPVADRTLTPGETWTLDLEADGKEVFSDPDNPEFTYTALSDTADVASVTVADGVVTVTGQADGTATITITAADRDDQVSTRFTVTVATTPTKPQLAVRSVGNGRITISWDPLGWATLIQYRLKVQDGDYGDWTTISSWNSRHTLTGLTNGTAHSIQLRATNLLGDHADSDEITATPRRPAPVSPPPVFRPPPAPPTAPSNPTPAPTDTDEADEATEDDQADETEETTEEEAAEEMFYSGGITGPDFCVNLSLGGATTYPFDSNSDGIADTCSLPRTRRAAIARQQALETLAAQQPTAFDTLFAQQCLQVKETYGEPAQEANDECAPHRGATTATQPSNDQEPDPAEPGSDFYTGIITGPDFCVNRSLGGATTYPFDSNSDGIADTCSLPRTRRAAIARQQALETLARNNSHLFDILLAQQCQRVKETYGEPAQEATDECAPHRTQPTPT
ncbi:S8 family serine peptidase [Candidatus Poriferisocius sp.]|uniref:S8 family serine peptidase n=1 Tax=Candidatus Poriferisocius sp. TaxID=3101276 RepID=UPI003B5B77FD